MKSRQSDRRILPAAATDLRTLVENYAYPLLVCDEDGCVRFFNQKAADLFAEQELYGRPLPPEWMDQEKVETDSSEHGPTVYRLLWEEVLWEGNAAWFLAAIPSESGTDELQSKLEHSLEMAATEVEKRQQVESDREKLEAKLRDLHQRSVSKLEAARNALEAEKAERQALIERVANLRQEIDALKAQLDEKSLQAEEAQHQSGEMFESLKAELISKQQALETAEQKSERYRRVYEEIDGEMTKSQEQSAVLMARLQNAEARFDRAQRLLDGDALEQIVNASNPTQQAELKALQERVVQLEGQLEASRASEQPSQTDSDSVYDLELECQNLRTQLQSAHKRVEELEKDVARPAQGSDGDSAELERLRERLDDTLTVVAELRLHNELELVEAREALSRLSTLSSTSNADDDLQGQFLVENLSMELEQAGQRIAELESALDEAGNRQNESYQQELETLTQRVSELETLLADAQSRNPSPESDDELQQAQGRVAALESQLERAQTEASPEELQFARQQISELERRLAQSEAASATPEASEDVDRLRNELNEAQAQINDLGSELRRAKDGDRETKKLAYADQLTGLPNYNLTGQYLQFCFERSSRGEGALALVLIDLDNFRRVNDALGTKVGDELLRHVGARLQKAVTEKDTAIARRGEDEFMVVAFLEGASVDGEALSARVRGIAHNLLNEIFKPFEILEQKIQITASLGVALYPGPAADRETLIEQCEHAMYKAKEAGRARVSFYTQDIHLGRERRIRVESELRQAVSDGNFTLLYQPILEIASSKIVGLEALLRWSHPQRGLLEPSEFLSVAEESGLILQLGDLVLAEAFEVAKQKFMKNRFISVNLSHRQLVDASFPQRFMKYLERSSLKPNEVMVEVSERATSVDPERAKITLAALAKWGVGLALDDFGSGASNLSLLREFPVKLVKIDGSITSNIVNERETARLCAGIARMAAAMEIPVLAENVETREQLEMVSTFGCRYAQGRLLSEPMSISQLSQAL